MRLTIHPDEGIWRLDGLLEPHLRLLRQAADDASLVDGVEGRARLLPSPISSRDAEGEEEFIADWQEFIAPELESQFASDVGTLLADLDEVQVVADTVPGTPRHYRLDVPLEHAPAWFSALNQARLLLDSRHALHSEDVQAIVQLIQPETDDEEEMARRAQIISIFIRYEFFGFIQEWLVRYAM
jgi:hypothetical protein